MAIRFALGLIVTLLTLSAQTSPFSNVSLLRRAIVPLGPTVEWKELAPGLDGGFFGTYLHKLQTSNFVESTIQYDISGKKSNRVDEVLLSSFVAAPEDMTPVRTTLSAFTSQWFKTVGIAIPAALITALKSQNQFKTTESNMTIDFKVSKCSGTPIKLRGGRSYVCSRMELTLRPK